MYLLASLKHSPGLGRAYETHRRGGEASPVHGRNPTVNVDKIRHFRPSYVWTKPFGFLPLIDRESTDRCFLYAYYGTPVVYADSMRNPCSTAPSFSCFSCAVFSKAWSARVVAATQPQATRLAGPPVVDAGAGGTCEPADRLMVRASSCAAALLPSPDRKENRTLTTGHVHAGKTAQGRPYTIQSTARVVG